MKKTLDNAQWVRAMSIPYSDRFAFTIAEACEISTLGRSKMLELVYSGTIRSKKVGRRLLILADSLREFVNDPSDAE